MNEAVVVFLFLGFGIGAVYDAFRFFRLIFKKKWEEFIIDFLFFFTISPIIFLFLLSYNNGLVRVFYFTAMLLGYLVYILTLYRVTVYIFRPIANGLRFVIKKSLKSFKKVLQSIKKVYYNMLRNIPLRFKRNKKLGKKKNSGGLNEEDFSEFNT